MFASYRLRHSSRAPANDLAPRRGDKQGNGAGHGTGVATQFSSEFATFLSHSPFVSAAAGRIFSFSPLSCSKFPSRFSLSTIQHNLVQIATFRFLSSLGPNGYKPFGAAQILASSENHQTEYLIFIRLGALPNSHTRHG